MSDVFSVAAGIEVVEVLNAPVEVVEVSGPQGPPGRDGAAGGKYTHMQPSPAATWIINHNLGIRPNVALLSVGGAEIGGEVLHQSENQALAFFVTPVAGMAACS